MRCSSCEPLLDRFLEGSLSTVQTQSLAKHVAQCESCARLLGELKVLDALLLTRTQTELPRNFTFAVMAEVNAMPKPRVQHSPAWSFVALYVVAAWVAAVAGMLIAGIPASSIAHALSSGLANFTSEVASVAGAISRGFGTQTSLFAAFGFTLLFVDLALAGAAACFYFFVRPRLAAHLAFSRERLS